MLINCAAYQGGIKVGDIEVEQISTMLSKHDTFVWVALLEPTTQELEALGVQFDLHELALEDASRGHQRPKMEEYGESLFFVIHTVETDAAGEIQVGEVCIFIGKNYVLSTRRNSHQGFAHVRSRCEREPELLKSGTAFVLYALMDVIVDRYFPVVAKLEQELETVEDKIFSKTSSARDIIEELYALKRKVMTVQHVVTPLMEAVGKMHGGRVPQVCQGMHEYFRDIDDHLVRVNKSIESIREMTSTAVQVNLSLITLGESEVSKKLAAYAALFGVPTAIAGIYGMNFKHMPELELAWGYPAVVFGIVLIDFLLWRHFRKVGWL